MSDINHYHFSEATYRSMLTSSLQYVSFDKIDRTLFDFESIFYPLSVDEGKYAFLSYMEQMENTGALTMGTQGAEELAHDRGKRDAVTSVMRSLAQGLVATNQALTEEDLEGLTEEDKQGDVLSDMAIDDEYLANEKMLTSIREKWGGGTMNRIDTTGIGGEEDNWLLIEPCKEWRHRLSVPQGQGQNRILVIASAGHGKSTFLRRLALYYANSNNDSVAHRELGDIYGLSENGSPIPCILYLRNIDEDQFHSGNVLESALADSVLKVVWTGLQAQFDKGEIEELPSQTQVFYAAEEWVMAHADHLMLLMDGLDELSESRRCELLSSLEDFLKQHPKVQVIMTSRVAGLLESVKEGEGNDATQQGVMKMLRRMKFRGRSIFPLNDKSAEAYGLRWIDATQTSEQRPLLKEALHKVQTQRKFAYLKTFMRTPLELLSVLKQLTRDVLSLNRSEMFRDMLWHLVTNHADGVSSKQALFDDTMTLLSFIAYHMQMKERLYLTQEELMALEHDFENLLFYTEVVGEDYAEMPKVLHYLDELAANVGIIERDERTNIVSYTFPIRSYQEFLCAYACTHLVLEEDISPVELLRKHLDNNHWWGVINFALSDLQQNNRDFFDVLIREVFTRREQDELVRTVLESNPTLTAEQAMDFCRCFFDTPVLSLQQRDLIMTCMETKSAYVYPYTLSALHQQKESQDPLAYVDALARMSVIQALNSNQMSVEKILEDIFSNHSHERVLAACMMYVLAEATVGLSLRPYMRQAREAVSSAETMMLVLTRGIMEGDDCVALYCARAWTLLHMNTQRECVEDLEDNARYRLYLAVEASYTYVSQQMEQGQVTGLGGYLVTLMDDFYVLGVLAEGLFKPVYTDVPYMKMVMRGCKQSGYLGSRLGQYLKAEAIRQQIEI